jgi:hypothetical protein
MSATPSTVGSWRRCVPSSNSFVTTAASASSCSQALARRHSWPVAPPTQPGHQPLRQLAIVNSTALAGNTGEGSACQVAGSGITTCAHSSVWDQATPLAGRQRRSGGPLEDLFEPAVHLAGLLRHLTADQRFEQPNAATEPHLQVLRHLGRVAADWTERLCRPCVEPLDPLLIVSRALGSYSTTSIGASMVRLPWTRSCSQVASAPVDAAEVNSTLFHPRVVVEQVSEVLRGTRTRHRLAGPRPS